MDFEPDIMTLAKGLGGGVPVAAILAKESASAFTPGDHGSTYGGNPLAMAAGNAVLDVVLAPGFLEHVRAMGDRLRQALEQLIPNYDDLFDSVRGMGLMLGVKLKTESRAFVAHLRDHHGLLTVAAGDNVVRILPPLTIDEKDIAECIERLSAGARDYAPAQAA
jgi:acetylornithine/N-succinyldiaminopimelate aminotransferase